MIATHEITTDPTYRLRRALDELEAGRARSRAKGLVAVDYDADTAPQRIELQMAASEALGSPILVDLDDAEAWTRRTLERAA